MRAAIMQPYFFPYAGYYRLLAAADVFVIYDCVQFPRRGWVHRNQLPRANGEPGWLTLPVEKAAYDAAIRDVELKTDAADLMRQRAAAFPDLDHALRHRSTHPAASAFLNTRPALTDYLELTLRVAARRLGFHPQILRSSALDIPARLKAQDRILAILEALGANAYVNAPGGRSLYDPQAFSARGIRLEFLPDYTGPRTSMLHRLLLEESESLRAEILGDCRLAEAA